MGEVLDGLGEIMATPVELGQALASIGLFVQAPAEADLARELKSLGSVELLRLELANWLPGAASMRVMIAQDAAIEEEVEATCITLAASSVRCRARTAATTTPKVMSPLCRPGSASTLMRILHEHDEQVRAAEIAKLDPAG